MALVLLDLINSAQLKLELQLPSKCLLLVFATIQHGNINGEDAYLLA